MRVELDAKNTRPEAVPTLQERAFEEEEGEAMRAETYAKKYRELAMWFLEHQTKIDFDEPEIRDLAEAIDVAIDNWIGEKRLGAASEESTGSRPSPVEESPTYRASLRDAGRGHLLR